MRLINCFGGLALEVLLLFVDIMDALIAFSSRVISFIGHNQVRCVYFQMRIWIVDW